MLRIFRIYIFYKIFYKNFYDFLLKNFKSNINLKQGNTFIFNKVIFLYPYKYINKN